MVESITLNGEVIDLKTANQKECSTVVGHQNLNSNSSLGEIDSNSNVHGFFKSFGQSEAQGSFVAGKQYVNKKIFKRNDEVFQGSTTQRDDYRKWDLSTRPPIVKQKWVDKEQKLANQTTHSADYVNHGPQQLWRNPKQSYEQNCCKFEGTSTNREDFVKFDIQPRQKEFGQSENLSIGGKFYGETENHQQFKKYELPKKFLIPKQPVLHNSKGFEMKTTHSLDYVDHGRGELYRHPIPVYLKNEAKFTGYSTTKSDYDHKVLVERVVGKLHKQNLTNGKTFYASTESRENFCKKEIPTIFKKEKQKYIPSESKLSDKTENKEKFVKHSILAKNTPVKTLYESNSAKLESSTTQKDSYTRWNLPKKERREAPKWESAGRFLGETTTSNDFKPIPCQKFKKVIENLHKNLPKDKFKGSTTYHDDFIGFPLKKRHVVPKQFYVKEADNRNFQTSNLRAEKLT